jgi:hypothetical protein
MKKVNWNFLYKRIPKTFKLNKKQFKVQWCPKFPDKKQVGESDWNNKLMTLKTGETHKETVHTYIHECLHLFSDEFDIKLSEKQVQKLEKTLHFWLKKGNIFK